MRNTVVVGLGSNLDDREYEIKESVNFLSTIGEVVVVSSLYESPPWGYHSSNAYLNACAEIETELSAELVLSKMIEYESSRGRVRNSEGYADRPIDMDIIYYNNELVEMEDLVIPHPYIANRNFVLKPLAEILPNFRHPKLGKTSDELLILSLDTSKCERIG